MKKISSILLVITMLVVSLVPMLALGVSAAAEGEVIGTHPNAATHHSYYFSSDEAAVEGGAIAKTTVTGLEGITTAYFKDIQAMGSYAASNIQGGNYGFEYWFLGAQFTVTNTNSDCGGRSVIFNGYIGDDGVAGTEDDGTTLTSTARFNLTGSTGSFTLNNVHIKSSWSKAALQTKTNSVILNNSSIEATAGATDGTIVLLGPLVMNEGSLIKNTVPATDNTVHSGVRIHSAAAVVTVNEGATIDTTGACITDKAAGSTTIINGGTLISRNRSVYASGNKSPLTVNGGTLISETNQPTIIAVGAGTKKIVGGTISNTGTGYALQASAGTTTISGGKFESKNTALLVGDGVTIGACEIIAEGNGISANGAVTIKDGAVVKAEKGRAVYSTASYDKDKDVVGTAVGNVTIEGGNFYSAGIAAAHADTTATLTINGGTFWSDKAIHALVCVGSQTTPGGTVTVNGGDYYFANGVKGTVFRNNESKDGNHTLTVNHYDSANNAYKLYVDGTGETEVEYITVPKVQDGASVRTVEDSKGIRFQSKLEKTVVEYLIENADSYEFGTIIAPVDYITAANGVFTPDALTAAGKTYLKIKAVNGIMTDDNGDYIINAAMIKIKENNVDRDFAAIGYLTYTVGDKTYNVYGAYIPENARSIFEVANRTLADVYEDGDILVEDDPETTDVNEQVVVDAAWREANGYLNAVTVWHEYNETTRRWEHKDAEEGQVKYSKYDPDQLDVVKSYVPY